MDVLTKMAGQFRKAIEITPIKSLPVTMKNFPFGSCGDATLLLGHYLKSNGFGIFQYALGERGAGEKRHSHAWLQRGVLLVDITADQFSEIASPVIVTTNSEWHDTFETKLLNEADFNVYDHYTRATLGAAYTSVLRSLG
nr:hypothetical protein [uncultured Cohaesibacter sp.]